MVLQQAPHFYFIEVEKNGQEERLTIKDRLQLSYRDEFVIKNIVSDDILGRNVSVDVDSLGTDSDLRRILKGVDLVDKLIANTQAPPQTNYTGDFGINILFGGKPIARIPIEVSVTPQDWLRHAQNTENQRRQIDYLTKAITANPQDQNVRKTLAAVYLRQGRFGDAIVQYRQILDARPEDTGVMAELVKCYLGKKDYAQAIKTAQQILRYAPKDAVAFASIAFAYSQMGDWEKTVANYQESLRLDPRSHALYFRLGEAYEKSGKVNDAIRQYQIFIDRTPNAVYGMMALADASLKAGLYEQAIKWYREILKREPKNAIVYANLGLALGSSGKQREEIENYKKAIALGAKEPAIFFNLAAAYEKEKRDADAAQVFRKLMQLKPNDPDVIEKAADYAYRRQNYDEAIKLYERIVPKAKDKAGIYAKMGFGAGELKRNAAAAGYYEKAIKFGNRDPQVLYNLAYTYEKLGKTKQAIELYERHAAKHPSREVFNIIAGYYMREKLYDKAVATYRRMLAHDPKKGPVYANIAEAYSLKGDPDNAIEYYRLSLKQDPEDYAVHLNLGLNYEKKGMVNEALGAFKTAYELNPDSKQAASKYRELRIKMLQQQQKK